ncbi:MAG: hypothetical protein QME94_07710 [Anaerolineae bacterium]|nr:hypothetical protein [Anaerolineae bacterium]
MPTDTIGQMGTHLQFLGYDVSHEDERTIARHPQKLNFSMKSYGRGVLFTAIMSGSKNAQRNKPKYLEFINTLNTKAAVVRFYADEDCDLFLEAWYPDRYERTEFGALMELWERDCLLLVANAADALAYLE